jgi:hypothetical protein
MAKTRKQMRKHRGGSQGSGYEPGGALNPGSGNGLMVNRSYDACMTSSRPGQMSYAPSSGLPGMRGGRYTTSLDGPIAGLAEYNKVGCTPNHVSPLNQHGGVGLASAKDMGVYEAHTARYTTAPSQWTGSTGAPVLLNQPLSGSMWSKSCSQTAGSRRKNRKNRNKKTKSKKSKRKVSRKRYSGGGPQMAKAAAKDELVHAEADLKMLMGKYQEAEQLAATAAADEAVSRAGKGTFLEDMIAQARIANEAVEFIKQAITQAETRISRLQQTIAENGE